MFSCDTLVATPAATADHVMIFAKNSDRHPNEPMKLVKLPRTKHALPTMVRCTHVDIPQTEETNAVLLCQPEGIWGAEMGSNEFGVTIGNEALFLSGESHRHKALLGMDLVRLALERADNAHAALDVITSLLQSYGQGGLASQYHSMYYQNSFIICDASDAWILETAGRHWVAKKVQDVASISNRPTIGRDYDLISPGMINHAIKQGWCKSVDDFSFMKAADFLYTHLSDAQERHCHTWALLEKDRGRISVQSMIKVLRDHEDINHPNLGWLGMDVCAHAACGPIRNTQTTCSMVSYIPKGKPALHLITGTASPCTSLFKPMWIDAFPKELTTLPRNADVSIYNPQLLRWRHERLHRSLLADFNKRMGHIRDKRDHLEFEFIDHALRLVDGSQEKRQQCADECLSSADQNEEKWITVVNKLPIRRRISFWYLWKWLSYNRAANIVIPSMYIHVAWKVRRAFLWCASLVIILLTLNKYRGLLRILFSRVAAAQLK